MTGKIIGTGSYIPDTRWDNNVLAGMMDTSDEWIRERTGIVSRHIADKSTVSEMACEAAIKALADAHESDDTFLAEDIDVIIVCTLASDVLLPAVSCLVAEKIGASKAFCYDLNAACSGFLFAYNTCVSYMNSGLVKNALIIGAEKLSEQVDWSDRGTAILFGDGAGAAIVTAADGNAHMVMHSDGSRYDALTLLTGQKMYMDGQKVFRFALKSVPEVIEELLLGADMKKSDVDMYVLHQANKRIIEGVAKRLGEDMEKFPMNLSEYGNTSSASIPILLDELKRSGAIRSGMNIVMAGFGAGLSWGAATITV